MDIGCKNVDTNERRVCELTRILLKLEETEERSAIEKDKRFCTACRINTASNGEGLND